MIVLTRSSSSSSPLEYLQFWAKPKQPEVQLRIIIYRLVVSGLGKYPFDLFNRLAIRKHLNFSLNFTTNVKVVLPPRSSALARYVLR